MSTMLFEMGQIVITAHAKDVLHPADVAKAMSRHAEGDWGETCEADWKENEVALAQGLRLFAVYRDRCGIKWIITEADRSATTVLLPDDY